MPQEAEDVEMLLRRFQRLIEFSRSFVVEVMRSKAPSMQSALRDHTIRAADRYAALLLDAGNVADVMTILGAASRHLKASRPARARAIAALLDRFRRLVPSEAESTVVEAQPFAALPSVVVLLVGWSRPRPRRDGPELAPWDLN